MATFNRILSIVAILSLTLTPAFTASTAAAPTSMACTYKGLYRIQPFYAPCNKLYFAFSLTKDCSSILGRLLSLRNMQQVYPNKGRLTWALNHAFNGTVGSFLNSAIKEGPIIAQRNCPHKYLEGTPEDPDNPLWPRLDDSKWAWGIEPFNGSINCNEVNLYAVYGPGRFYFNVPRSCDLRGVTWTGNPTGRSRYKLTKIS